MLFKTLSLAVFFAVSPSVFAQIYADFTTSKGNFTAQLNYTVAPKAVANFIGLAEGSRDWIDPATGAIRSGQPYYNGVTFHRVIADFMSQTGSRNGLGNDGPGYVFVDETNNSYAHSGAGVLSMANSGPNTNGAQFFITDAAAYHLTGFHTIFGNISSGQTVVDAINNVSTTNERPKQAVVIHSIAIRRVGSAAQAFNIHAQNLPVVSGIAGKLDVVKGTKSDFLFSEPVSGSRIFTAFRSTDLQAWSLLGQRFQDTQAGSISNLILDDAALPTAFYQLTSIHYPNSFGPASTGGRTLSTVVNGESLQVNLNAAGTGGTVLWSGNGYYPIPITRALFAPSPLGGVWQILAAHSLYELRFCVSLTQQNSTQFVGNLRLDRYVGAWYVAGYGAVTVSK